MVDSVIKGKQKVTEISGFLGGEYEDDYLLGCCAV
jgi:hypothetical protein